MWRCHHAFMHHVHAGTTRFCRFLAGLVHGLSCLNDWKIPQSLQNWLQVLAQMIRSATCSATSQSVFFFSSPKLHARSWVLDRTNVRLRRQIGVTTHEALWYPSRGWVIDRFSIIYAENVISCMVWNDFVFFQKASACWSVRAYNIGVYFGCHSHLFAE